MTPTSTTPPAAPSTTAAATTSTPDTTTLDTSTTSSSVESTDRDDVDQFDVDVDVAAGGDARRPRRRARRRRPLRRRLDVRDVDDDDDVAAVDDDDVEGPVRLPDTGEVRPITFPVVGGGIVRVWLDGLSGPGCTRFHKGTDVMAVKLQPLVSPVDGVVARFLRHPTAGVGIVIRGDDGYEYRLYHLNNDKPGTDDGRAGAEWSFGDGLAPGDAGGGRGAWSGLSVIRATPRTIWRTCTWRSVALMGCRSTRTGRCSRPAATSCSLRPPSPRSTTAGCGSSGCRCRRRGSVPATSRCVSGLSRRLRVGGVGAPVAQAVPLTSSSSTQQVRFAQFDPAEGALEQVTVTLTVDAGAAVEVTNLTAAAKSTTVVLDASASAAGPGVGGLGATAGDSGSATIGAGASSGFTLDGVRRRATGDHRSRPCWPSSSAPAR